MLCRYFQFYVIIFKDFKKGSFWSPPSFTKKPSLYSFSKRLSSQACVGHFTWKDESHCLYICLSFQFWGRVTTVKWIGLNGYSSAINCKYSYKYSSLLKTFNVKSPLIIEQWRNFSTPSKDMYNFFNPLIRSPDIFDPLTSWPSPTTGLKITNPRVGVMSYMLQNIFLTDIYQ